MAGAAAVALVAGGLALRPDGARNRTTVSIAAPPPSTVVIPAPEGGREVRVPAPLPPMPAEAPVWSAIPPTLASVQALASALGVNGTVFETPPGFNVSGGNAGLRVMPVGGAPGWRFEMDPCPVGRCRPPDVRPAVPVPTVEARDAPDHPPFEAAPVAADAARRIATALGNVIVPHLQMSLSEWWADFTWLAGSEPVQPGFRVYLPPDGSVRGANGFLDRPGQPGAPQRLVGVDEALRRLAAPTAMDLYGGVLCEPAPCRPTLVVTGVRLGLSFEADRFVPTYIFTLDDGGERSVRAV